MTNAEQLVLEKELNDLEIRCQIIRDLLGEKKVENGRIEILIRQRLAEEHRVWYENWNVVLSEFLKPGMIVKFTGTKDRKGYRRVEEIRRHRSRFNLENKEVIRFEVVGRKMVFNGSTMTNCDLIADTHTTQNGLDKLTHVRRDGQWVGVKEIVEKQLYKGVWE